MRTFEINTNGYPNTFMVQISFITEAFLISDEIKYRIFETIKNSLLILLIQGDQLEKYVSLNLLNNFAFDDVLCEKLCQNMNFLASTSQILNSNEKTEELLRSVAICFRTLLNMKQTVQTYNKKCLATPTTSSIRQLTNISLATTSSAATAFNSNPTTTTTTTTTTNGNNDDSGGGDDKYVFLSSHDSNELICLRIKHELENRGYTVVMSERKAGKSFDMDKVIRAIEMCSCLLACISSSYQCEQLCQLEVHYASKLNKTIVPCIVQPTYEPDYWLESLMREKRSIKVKLPSIVGDMNALSKEIASKAKLKPKPNAPFYTQKSSTTCLIL